MCPNIPTNKPTMKVYSMKHVMQVNLYSFYFLLFANTFYKSNL